ncbi:hypothetical protein SISSUDRAFT_655333 [Sistotremastrum suecicum HHB10207 ss-3]|uniref:Uncharacterized protein n=1 Tax=Sistotremastrum suecicum HHB10207 ss-3 TaxID=1314776 RepID=A0A165X3V7_9AGAM|nr:hypothetical protein SISSUDRAFT_655333 [Sistotremastrum suecicum HHB10207 ss-3]
MGMRFHGLFYTLTDPSCTKQFCLWISNGSKTPGPRSEDSRHGCSAGLRPCFLIRLQMRFNMRLRLSNMTLGPRIKAGNTSGLVMMTSDRSLRR